MDQEYKNVATAMIRFNSITEADKKKKEKLNFIKKVAQLNPM